MTEEPGERPAADTPYTTELDTLISKAHTASEAETMLQRVRVENQVVADACEAVRELSEAGDLSEAQMNGLAENLSRLLEQYTKTDLKTEFREYFGERSGEPFDEIIETRLETVKIIANTDAKQGSVFRWHFSDGVKLETETSDEGSRLHYSWNHFRDLYFDALLAENRGEAIADPTPERRGGEEWRDWISDVILDHSETVEHVGPRTEAVRQLRDYISRSVGYTDLAKVSERAGIGIDVDDATQTVADLDADTQLFVPRKQITRVCEQTGISSRALQIELDAREVTSDAIAGVSQTTYLDGCRFPYWVVTLRLATPQELVAHPESPAEQLRREQQERREEEATDVGVVADEDDSAGCEGALDGEGDSDETEGAAEDGDGSAGPSATSDRTDSTEEADSGGASESDGGDQEDTESVGMQSSLGTDPDGETDE